MKISLFWSEILHYHLARIAALIEYAANFNVQITAFAIQPISKMKISLDNATYNLSVQTLLTEKDDSAMKSSRAAGLLEDLLEKEDPDVVAIIGYETLVALQALTWCRRRGKGAILMFETKQDDYPRFQLKEVIKKRIVNCYDTAIVSGSPQKAYVLDLGIPPEYILLGYASVDNQYWMNWSDRVKENPDYWRQKNQLPNKYFLTACRLVEKKNVDGLLQAYALYRELVNDPWSLVIAGDGPMEGQLRQLADDLGIKDSVIFLGYLSPELLGPVYSLSEVFILASKYSEQWGLVVNEGMAAGKAVLVSSQCGCARDLVIEGVTGFSFNPANNDELVKKMRDLTIGVYDLEKIGKQAQLKIEEFSPSIFAENLFSASSLAIFRAKSRKYKYYDYLVANLARSIARLNGGSLSNQKII